jgi:predicted MFS family arabinose efflux permease
MSGSAARPSLWRDRRFVRFWIAQTVPLAGSAVAELLLPMAAVFALHASPLEVGVLGLLSYVPYLVLTLPSGVWADRRRRKPTMIGSDLVRCLASAWVPVMALLGDLSLWQLYAAAFVIGGATVTGTVAGQAFLPSALPRDRLVEANAKLAVGETATDLGGPALGGMLATLITAPVALVVSAFSFGVSVLMLSTLRVREVIIGEHGTNPLKEIAEGLRFTFTDFFLRRFAFWAAAYNIGQAMTEAVLFIYLTRQLGFSAGAIGVLKSVGYVGGMGGALIVGRASGRFGLGRAMVLAGMVAAGSYLLLPLPSSGGILALALVAVAFLFDEGGSAVSMVLVQSVRLGRASTEEFGRVSASSRFVTMGVIPVGYLVGGALGNTVGPRMTLLIGAAVICISIPCLAAPRIFGMKELPQRVTSAAKTVADALLSLTTVRRGCHDQNPDGSF